MALAITADPSAVKDIGESRDDARGTEPIEIAGRMRLCDDTLCERIDWDIPVAEATLDLVAAYRHLHDVLPQTLPPWAIPLFGAVCDSLCSTIVAIDHLTANLWGREPA